MPNLDQISFRLVSDNEEGDIDQRTIFEYQQQDSCIWGRYYGPTVRAGVLFGTMDESGDLDFVYSHVDHLNQLKRGHCFSTLEKLPSGLLRYHEKWSWTGDQKGSGSNIIEQIPHHD